MVGIQEVIITILGGTQQVETAIAEADPEVDPGADPVVDPEVDQDLEAGPIVGHFPDQIAGFNN